MNCSLIICTYQRPEAINKLLLSLGEQVLLPTEILIIDASGDYKTKKAVKASLLNNIRYFQVGEKDKGLTRQRNFGIANVSKDAGIICFLDDDIVLKPKYFSQLIETYSQKPDALAVGGYIINDVDWGGQDSSEEIFNRYYLDGYSRPLSSRHLLRKKLGLLSNVKPGYMPKFSNGFSTGFLPPSGKTYEVEYFMGGVSSYRQEVFKSLNFSEYFHGYGLYEDMDFCLRLSKLGKLYVNTSAQLYHYHDEGGRPNRFKYGKMVARNGWYVWRLKYANPSFKNMLKWHATLILLTAVRMGNIITTSKRKQAFTESMGRISGWFSLLANPPKIRK